MCFFPTEDFPLFKVSLQSYPSTTKTWRFAIFLKVNLYMLLGVCCSYASLIRFAITNAPQGKMTLSEIYQFIIQTFPYYRDATTGWKVSESLSFIIKLHSLTHLLMDFKHLPGHSSWEFAPTYKFQSILHH